jgi:hypothetical protein
MDFETELGFIYQNPTIHCACKFQTDCHCVFCECPFEEYDTFLDCVEESSSILAPESQLPPTMVSRPNLTIHALGLVQIFYTQIEIQHIIICIHIETHPQSICISISFKLLQEEHIDHQTD